MIQERNEVTMNVKSIKKMAIVFLLLAIFVSLVGCGKVNEDTTSVSTESSEAKAQFMNNYSDYKSFSDIKPYNNESGSVGTGGGRKSKDHQKAPGGGTPPPPPPPDRG